MESGCCCPKNSIAAIMHGSENNFKFKKINNGYTIPLSKRKALEPRRVMLNSFSLFKNLSF